MRAKHRRGFSVADVIIVAIMMLLMGSVLVPLLVDTKEKADQTQCADNIRRLSGGANTFHGIYRRFPPGVVGHADAVTVENWTTPGNEQHWARTQNTSFIALTLPFIQQSQFYDKCDPIAYDMYKFLDEHIDPTRNKRFYSWFTELKGFQEVATTNVEQFTCPSDKLDSFAGSTIIAIQPVLSNGEDSDDFGVIRYTHSTEKVEISKFQNGKPEYQSVDRSELGLSNKDDFARTSYIGSAGAYSGGRHPNKSRRPYAGLMSSRSRVMRATVRDGLSNTIMLGESLGQVDDGKRNSVQGWFSAGLGRGRGHIDWMKEADERTGPFIGDLKNSSEFGFGSAHVSGANFAFGDSSVRVFSRKIDRKVFYQLNGANDGESANVKKYVVDLDSPDPSAMLREMRQELTKLDMKARRLRQERIKIVDSNVKKLQSMVQKMNEDGDKVQAAKVCKEILRIKPTDKFARNHFEQLGQLDAVLRELNIK